MTRHRPHDRDESTQTGAAIGSGPNRDTVPEDEEHAEGPLGDIADEVRRRRAQGQGRRPPQPEGSEGAVGKLEGGEW